MRAIDLLLAVNSFFVCLIGYVFFSVARYMYKEGGELAEGFGIVLSLPFLIWHLAILLIAYSKKVKVKENYTFDDRRAASRLFIWTFLPWLGILFLWMFF